MTAGRSVEQLVSRANGDSVTVDRLTGEARFFINCRPWLDNSEQPHHLLCLTTEYTQSGNAYVEVENAIKRLSKYDQASVLFTDTHIRVIFEDRCFSFAYGAIDYLEWYDRPSIVIGYGRRTYYFELARSAISNYEFMDAVTFACEELDFSHSGHEVDYTLSDLDEMERLTELRERGAISDDEFEMLKYRLLHKDIDQD